MEGDPHDPDRRTLEERGEALRHYLSLPPEEGGPQPPSDDETSRPSPIKEAVEAKLKSAEAQTGLTEEIKE